VWFQVRDKLQIRLQLELRSESGLELVLGLNLGLWYELARIIIWQYSATSSQERILNENLYYRLVFYVLQSSVNLLTSKYIFVFVALYQSMSFYAFLLLSSIQIFLLTAYNICTTVTSERVQQMPVSASQCRFSFYLYIGDFVGGWSNG